MELGILLWLRSAQTVFTIRKLINLEQKNEQNALKRITSTIRPGSNAGTLVKFWVLLNPFSPLDLILSVPIRSSDIDCKDTDVYGRGIAELEAVSDR